MLFAGTKLLTSTASSRPRFPGLPSDGCVGVVLRTGYETAQGKLIRTIVHTADRVSANSKRQWGPDLVTASTAPSSRLYASVFLIALL